MSNGFHRIRYRASDKNDSELRALGTRGLGARGIGRPQDADPTRKTFHNDEAAARHFASRVFERDGRGAVRGLTAPDSPRVVPDLELESVQDSPHTATRLVRFRQTRDSIPVFGSRILVELDAERELVDMQAEVGDVQEVRAVASLGPGEALRRLAEQLSAAADAMEEVAPPQLNFFHDEEQDRWHLAYLVRDVPALPPEEQERAHDRRSEAHAPGSSPREVEAHYDYLVDAHDGEVLFYFSAGPMLDVPVKCRGTDVRGQLAEFWGREDEPQGFEMSDPMRGIRTFDLEGADLAATPLPSDPVDNPSPDWQASNTAAVSAHRNASRVFDFYNAVLKRNGIDDAGMEIVSVVNCIYGPHGPGPVWRNAVWFDGRMWYGQDTDDNGDLRSFARFLDVIAHELTHGVIEHTSNLVYRNQSGALNESFADIFGIITYNWYEVGPDSDTDSWTWELGAGLGPGDGPLRDLSDPTRTGDPDHMDDYWHTARDHGGVHTNSNIHNKAAFNVLTATDGNGNPVFPPREVAILYYLTLVRLNRLATFSDCLETLETVASVFYQGSPPERDAKIRAIRDAYGAVGIT